MLISSPIVSSRWIFLPILLISNEIVPSSIDGNLTLVAISGSVTGTIRGCRLYIMSNKLYSINIHYSYKTNNKCPQTEIELISFKIAL